MRNDYRLNEAVAYLHGRIDEKIEQCADAVGIPAMELAARLSELLSHARARSADSLWNLPGTAAFPLDNQRPALEMGSGSREDDPRPPDKPARTNNAIKKYWAQFSPEERSREVKRRMNLSGSGKQTQKQAARKRASRQAKDMKHYWASMTPTQRRKEAKRRTELRLKTMAKRAREEAQPVQHQTAA
jgi:hypothetical protein